MDAIIASIKEYALIINNDLTDDSYLDFVIADVIDRTLVFTGRDQLVEQYEEDLLDTTVEEEDYVLPIPSRLERPLASVVVGVHKTVQENTEAKREIMKISDNGQSVDYSGELASYLFSKSDAEIFSGVKDLLIKIRIPTIGDNTGGF